MTLPLNYEMTFPREPGPAFSRQLRLNHKEYIEENQSNIVLLGDSTLVLGLDTNQLSEQTSQPVYTIGIPGSASALWYLLLKNNIAEATYKPQYLLIVFRDSILTAPGYRVHGSYFEVLDEYTKRNEPVLLEKSFINLMSPFEILAEKYFPLYALRSNIRKEIDASIRYFAPPLFGCDRTCTDYSLGALFEGADMEPGELVDAVGAAESLLYTPAQLDFEELVDKSFLPDMIEISKEKNINLVFVRIKVLSGPQQSPELDKYLMDLKNYFNTQNSPYLDLGSDIRFTPDLFRDSIHLNESGKELFTELVAQELNKLLSEK